MYYRILLLGLTAVLSAMTHAQDVRITQHSPVQITSPQLGANNQELLLEFDGQQQRLIVTKNQKLVSVLSATQRNHIANQTVAFYTGHVLGDDTSWLRMSWLQGCWEGIIHYNNETFLIDRLNNVRSMLENDREVDSPQVIYSVHDLYFEQGIDIESTHVPGREDEHTDAATGGDMLSALLRIVSTETLVLPLSIIADEEFINTHGESSTSIILARVNQIDGIYSNYVGVEIQLQSLALLGDNSSLSATDPSMLINAFRSYMTTGDGRDIAHDGVAHLFTGKNLDGFVIGMTWMNVLCDQDYGFAIDQNLSSGTTSMLVVAHELGHNFGAPHDLQSGSICEDADVAGIMNPFINGSTEFSACSMEQMADNIANASCLTEPFDMTFLSSFE